MVVADLETRILDAAKRCREQWSHDKVTVDDIAQAAGVSRATLYRIFPGGKDVLFEALRVRERTQFFDLLTAEVDDADDLEDLVVRLVVTATRELRADEHLALMLASEPGETLVELTAEGMPRIVETATDYLGPLLKPHLDPEIAPLVIELLVRLTLSYFLAPSVHVDFGDPESARAFLRPGLSLLPPSTPTTTPTRSPEPS
ncbi:MAG: TetR/AcrR family transcriptional regulator [Acidimicrobiia bacterium]